MCRGSLLRGPLSPFVPPNEYFQSHYRQLAVRFVGCKMHYLLESVPKILSTFILAGMSFDQYLRVCHPCSGYRYHNPKTTSVLLILFIFAAVALLFPLVYSAGLVEYEIGEYFSIAPQVLGRFSVQKCRDRFGFLYLFHICNIHFYFGLPASRNIN